LKTVSIFTSTIPESLVRFLGGLGFANNTTCEVKPDGITDVSARLLGIRYTVQFTGGNTVPEIGTKKETQQGTNVLGTNAFEENQKADIIYSGYEITENKSVLPVGFYVPTAQIQTVYPSDASPFEQTNDWFVRMGVEAVYEKNTLAFISSNNVQQTLDTDSFSIESSGLTASITIEPQLTRDQKDVLLYVDTDQKISDHTNEANDRGEFVRTAYAKAWTNYELRFV
jgi:hypothetical protein